MKIWRKWAMPNKDTFRIIPIYDLICEYIDDRKIWVDPFVGSNPFASYCLWTNDLNLQIPATHHLESLEFLSKIETGVCDGVFFDPPYSPRQISECYKSVGLIPNMEDTQASFWGDRKKEVARIVRSGGIVITCGWNSGGIGKSLGFKIEEVLLVPHGGWHNDTIVVVERKL